MNLTPQQVEWLLSQWGGAYYVTAPGQNVARAKVVAHATAAFKAHFSALTAPHNAETKEI